MTQTHEQPTYVDFHNNWLDTVAKRSSLGFDADSQGQEKVVIWRVQNERDLELTNTQISNSNHWKCT